MPEGLKKLVAGEVDLWLGSKEMLEMAARKYSINPDDVEPVVFVHRLDLYMAFNKSIPLATVDAWQEALDSLKK